MANPLFTGVVTVLVVVILEGACPPDCTLYSAYLCYLFLSLILSDLKHRYHLEEFFLEP